MGRAVVHPIHPEVTGDYPGDAAGGMRTGVDPGMGRIRAVGCSDENCQGWATSVRLSPFPYSIEKPLHRVNT